MAGSVAANGETLLVPMHLDALVINKKITARDAYNRWRMNYKQMKCFGNPMPPPFHDQESEPPPVGVHLHWALPDGMTHGVEDESGGIEFPYVPNRWLVVRIQPGGSPTGASLIVAWVILSDMYGDDCASPFLDPDPQKSKPGDVVPTGLGARVTIQEWDRMMGEKGVDPVAPFLRAIGPGNVTFAAFAPGVEDVFAFKCGGVSNYAQNLEILVTNQGLDVIRVPSLFDLVEAGEKHRFEAVLPHGERTVLPGETAAFYCYMDELEWSRAEEIVFYDNQGNEYPAAISRR